MPQRAVCPDVTQYQQLAAGSLADADEEALLEHLERCAPCAQKLNTIAEPDTLVELIRRARARGDRAANDALAHLVQRLSKLRPSVAPGSAEETVPPRELPRPPQLAFACPSCGKRLKVKGELAGKTGKCPHCKKSLRVPAVSDATQVRQAEASPTAATGTMSSQPQSLLDTPTVGGGKAANSFIDPRAGHLHQLGHASKELYDFLAPAQAPDELGRLGPYRVLKVLGAGGMGVVFRAEDPQLARLVALKAMLPTLAASESARQRFLREARAAAAIKHDHIVTIYQVGEDRGVPFLAMEFLEGESLDARLQREGKLPLAEVLRIGREIALGLAAAHKRELIHRDIKPANVWLEGETGRVKILDFGLARAVGQENQLTQQGAIVGTPAYMAPEQAQGQSVDPRSDLFSLGCVLYRIATGEPPFRGTDMVSTLLAVVTEEPRLPHDVVPGLPPALSELILRLLAKAPEDRPASAQVVAEALERVPAGAARQTAPEPGKVRLGSPDQQGARRRRWAVVVAIAVLLGIGGWFLAPMLFKVKVNTPEGEAFVVLQIDQPGAEVVVDGQKMTVNIPGDNKPVEIQVEAGQHKLRITKDGFVAVSRDIELKTGKSEPIRVRLEPLPKTAQKEVPATVPADALRREAIPEAVLATLGGGDPNRAPPELVAVEGDGRFRIRQGGSRIPAFSPDGSLLAVPSGGEIFVFDAHSGQLLRRIRCCGSVAFSRDSAMLAVGENGLVRLWDARTGAHLRDISGHASGWMSDVTFTPDSKTVVSSSVDRTVRAWDVATGRSLQVFTCNVEVRSLAVSGDGKLVFGGAYDSRIHAWSLESGAELFNVPIEVGPSGACVAVSADGKWLAAGTNAAVKVWKVSELGQKPPPPLFEKRTPAAWLQFAGDSGKLWTAALTDQPSDRSASCWDPASGQRVSSIPLQSASWVWMGGAGHLMGVHEVAFSPDGQWLASAGEDHTVRIWDLATGTPRHRLEEHPGPVRFVAFSPDSSMLASASSDGALILWDVVAGARARTLSGYCGHGNVRFSSDGKLVAAGTPEGSVRMWFSRNGEEARVLPGLHEGLVLCLAFSADGKRLASGGEDGKVVITDLDSGKVLESFQRKTAVWALEFSADGQTVAAGYALPEPVVRLWSLKDRDFVALTGHSDGITSIRLRSDGRLAVTMSLDGSVRLWEVGGNLPRKLVLGMGSAGEKLWSGALSPDGRYVATGNSNGTIYLFRLPGPAENISEWLAARGSPPPGLSQDAWLERVKGLYFGTVPEAVAERLRELNRGFDGKMEYGMDGKDVVHLYFLTPNVTDISPLRALPGLRSLACGGSWWARNGQVADLTPLQGMKLTSLNCLDTQVADLSPLKGMPLTSLECGNTKVSDLSPLRGMPLTNLNVYVTEVADLSPLKDMKTLERLNLYRTPVATLSPVKDLKLTFLQCHATALTAAGLAPLEEMTSLRELWIGGGKMTEDGLAHLERLTNMERLALQGIRITEAGLRHLAGMTKLHTLLLLNTGLTDRELIHLKGFTALRVLELRQTQVSDAGLEHLAGLKNLVELNLQETGVTDAGVAKLKAALPKCNIIR
jgi:WD40 repeat protein